MADCILVSYEPSNKTDASLLLVGHKQNDKDVVIVNAFQGKEATELWNKLINKKEK